MTSWTSTAFLAGALLGGTLAVAALLWPDAPEPLDAGDVAARVNGYGIPIEDLALALEAMARDSRNPLPPDSAERALGRLIDEELLLQRGLELDLPRNAPGVRRAIVLAMIDTIIADDGSLPDEATLRALFDANVELFISEPRLRVDWVMAASPEGDRSRPAAAPPNTLLRTTQLRTYLGNTLTRAALEADPGDTIGPLEISNQYHWLTVLEREDAPTPRFEDNRERVQAVWSERMQEQALEAYLAGLRARAEIQTQPIPAP